MQIRTLSLLLIKKLRQQKLSVDSAEIAQFPLILFLILIAAILLPILVAVAATN
jgi:hypothetical protein